MLYKTSEQTIKPYLQDASNYSNGFADKVVIPESVEELVDFLNNNQEPITVAGAGTGMTASRIPNCGLVISLEKFSKLGIIGNNYIDVGPAVSLKDLNEHLACSDYFYPPNPTELLASIGGNVSTNASGSRSYKYGSTRDYVIEADIVLADGQVTTLKRGSTIENPLKLANGRGIDFPEISYKSPTCKNAAGYFVRPGMDWLDLFIGSDGTLCIFTRVRLKLIKNPAQFISGVIFFKKEEKCWELVHLIKNSNSELIKPCSLEYFDGRSLNRLRNKFERIPQYATAALFFENDIQKIDDYELTLNAWFDFLNVEGIINDDSWFSQSAKDIKRFHEFRHSIPVIINEENSKLGRLKIGTDMAVPDRYFFEMMRLYKLELEQSKIDFVTFGHIGDNHLHINLLPEPNQIDKAYNIYDTLVNHILGWQGTVSAEHGIGKLKRKFFSQMVGNSSLQQLKTIKRIFDPRFLLGNGNLF